jgi:acetyl-CoA C-acetyltransferase
MKPTIIGYYTTRFGELWDLSLTDLLREASFGALESAGIEKTELDAVVVSNMLSGILENNLHMSSKMAEILDLHIPMYRVEAACASGAMAVQVACQYVAARPGSTVLVVGAEKMNDYAPEQVSTALTAAASGEEQESGLTFPGLYGMMARAYLEQYHFEESVLAHPSFQNHAHGALNDNAHFQRPVSLEAISKSALVADPLRVLHSSPISDGAAAVIITSKPVKQGATIAACEVATDSISLKHRKSLVSIEATQIAARLAFEQAGLTRSDIHVAEVHDCFANAQLMAMEDLGFWSTGTAGSRIVEHETMIGNGGSLIVNPSGGLKAAGHPVGATGIKQVGEIYLQLMNKAGKRQVRNAQAGLAHNVGGSGGTAVVTILVNQ